MHNSSYGSWYILKCSCHSHISNIESYANLYEISDTCISNINVHVKLLTTLVITIVYCYIKNIMIHWILRRKIIVVLDSELIFKCCILQVLHFLIALMHFHLMFNEIKWASSMLFNGLIWYSLILYQRAKWKYCHTPSRVIITTVIINSFLWVFSLLNQSCLYETYWHFSSFLWASRYSSKDVNFLLQFTTMKITLSNYCDYVLSIC